MRRVIGKDAQDGASFRMFKQAITCSSNRFCNKINLLSSLQAKSIVPRELPSWRRVECSRSTDLNATDLRTLVEHHCFRNGFSQFETDLDLILPRQVCDLFLLELIL